jgi:NAD(P)-dependent dehydrogenase (short-subunit alcohol dehydrogenase family)
LQQDFKDRVVLITGGTRGIGLACGLAFGRQGARTVLTHRWGSADEDELRARFVAVGAPPPLVIEADASREEDTARLLGRLKEDPKTTAGELVAHRPPVLRTPAGGSTS